jgi:hypothetical protein
VLTSGTESGQTPSKQAVRIAIVRRGASSYGGTEKLVTTISLALGTPWLRLTGQEFSEIRTCKPLGAKIVLTSPPMNDSNIIIKTLGPIFADA